MNKFVQLFYGMVFIITYVIQTWDHGRFFAKNEMIVPFVGFRLEW